MLWQEVVAAEVAAAVADEADNNKKSLRIISGIFFML